MSQQDYFIQFASELGKLNGNIESVLKSGRREQLMCAEDGCIMTEIMAQ